MRALPRVPFGETYLGVGLCMRDEAESAEIIDHKSMGSCKNLKKP